MEEVNDDLLRISNLVGDIHITDEYLDSFHTKIGTIYLKDCNNITIYVDTTYCVSISLFSCDHITMIADNCTNKYINILYSNYVELYSKKYIYSISVVDGNNILLNLNNVGYITYEYVKKSSITMYKMRELSLVNSSLWYIKSTYIGRLDLYQTKIHHMYGYVYYIDNSNLNSVIQDFKSVLYDKEIVSRYSQCMLNYILKNTL